MNAKWFGAMGDNSTNDYLALQRAINCASINFLELYIPYGTYRINQKIVATGRVWITGAGCANQAIKGRTRLVCDSPTGTILELNAGNEKVTLRDFHVENLSTTAPTSGTGFDILNANGLEIKNLSVLNFYNNIQIDKGFYYSISGLYCFDPVNYGVLIKNTQNADIGDMSIFDSYFIINYFPTRSPNAAVHWESSGGLRFSNNKINYTGQVKWVNGLEFVPTGVTSVCLITSNSIENCSNNAIHMHSETLPVRFEKIIISANEIGLIGNTGIYIRGHEANPNTFQLISATGNTIDGSLRGVYVEGANGVNVSNNVLNVVESTVVFGSNTYNCVQNNNTLVPRAKTDGNYNDILIFSKEYSPSEKNSQVTFSDDREIPAGTSKVAYRGLWDVTMGMFRSTKIIVEIEAIVEGGGAVYIKSERLMYRDNTNNVVISNIGTDYHSVENLIDLEFETGLSIPRGTRIKVKVNNSSTGTTITGVATMKTIGRVNRIVRYN